ncbi:MAG: hypothetical protein ACI9MR_002484 [Myxococcota bacterium]|jgi:hypothetical protein
MKDLSEYWTFSAIGVVERVETLNNDKSGRNPKW